MAPLSMSLRGLKPLEDQDGPTMKSSRNSTLRLKYDPHRRSFRVWTVGTQRCSGMSPVVDLIREINEQVARGYGWGSLTTWLEGFSTIFFRKS